MVKQWVKFPRDSVTTYPNTKSKGVIGSVRPDHLMPGGADMILDPNSIVHRMNLGNKYEGYLTYNIIKLNEELKAMKGNTPVSKMDDERVEKIFDYVFQYIKLYGNKQAEYMEQATIKDKRQVISEVQRILLPIDNPKMPIEITLDIMKSNYATKEEHLNIPINENETIKSHNKMSLEANYVMLLYKIADTGLSASSYRVNTLGVPVSPNKVVKDALNFNNTPTKILSESETRMYLTLIGPEAIMELRDRTNNPDTHLQVMDSILTADNPFDIEENIDMSNRVYGQEVPRKIVRSINNTFGMDLKYVEGETE